MSSSQRVEVPVVALGNGLDVSALGFGAMGLSHVYGLADRETSLAALNAALDAGVTFLDTADVYGGGENERLLGELLAVRGEEVTLATKFGIVAGGGVPGDLSARGDAAYVRQACDASLERLGVDKIDLYYLHRRDLAVSVEETVSAMAELVTAGKVRHLGLSEVTASELREACAVHPIAAVQSEWSIWSRDVERTVVPAAAELGVGFVPYSPLGRGFLTGAFRDRESLAGDWRANLRRFSGDAFDQNLALVAAIAAVAETIDATPAQVALAWLRQRGVDLGLPVVAIPGTRRAERVVENVGSLSVDLDPQQMAELDALAGRVVGPRSDSQNPNWVSDTRE